MIENSLNELFQSAYKTSHNTESALIRLQNDVLRAIDDGRCVILLLLDLLAAYNTVDHEILLSRLSSCYGIEGTVHKWFRSYLCDRMQFVVIENAKSSSRPLTCERTTGICSWPILYLLYTTPLGDISYHMYADDTHIYLTFKSSVLGDMEHERVEACVRDIYRWMLYNNLKINNDKTELDFALKVSSTAVVGIGDCWPLASLPISICAEHRGCVR